MLLSNNKYYILRFGDFATDANTKIIYCIFPIILGIEEYITDNSSYCLEIMLKSTIIWSFVEFLLHITGTRVIKPMYFHFNDASYLLPRYISVCLQGAQEGGFVTTLGLYFGDRIFIPKYFILLHLLLLTIVFNIYIKKNYVAASTRQINTRSSVLLISSMTLYNINCLTAYPEHFYRQMYMFFSMIYISSVWTLSVWYFNFRTVEVYALDDKQEYYKRPTNYFNTFLILAYDVVFEIGIAYLTFYNLFLI